MITNAHCAHLLLNTKEILEIVQSQCVVMKICNANGNLLEYFFTVMGFIPQTIESGSII
jgi:hypothetical protein